MGNTERGIRQLVELWEHPDFQQPISDGRVREREPLHPGLRRAVIGRDRGVCDVCKIRPSRWSECDDDARLEVDHLLPHAAGGPEVSTNLRTLCRYCNRAKSNIFTADVRIRRPRLIVAYCYDDVDLDDENLLIDQRVYCGFCRGYRSVDRVHAQQYELGSYLPREPGWHCKDRPLPADGVHPDKRDAYLRMLWEVSRAKRLSGAA